MIRIAAPALALVLTTLAASPAAAQPQVDADKVLAAAPPNQREAATIVAWKADANGDYSYDVVRKGTNRLVCYDRSGQPGQQAFSVECTSIANLPRVAQNMKFDAMGPKRQAALDAAEKDGTRVKPEFGSVFYNLNGQDQQRARKHVTVAVPGATSQTLGLPENGSQGGAWIMNAGTTSAHIMTPGQ